MSDRRRLCAAARRPLAEAAALLDAQVDAAGAGGVEFFQVREPDLAAGALVVLVRRLQAVARGRVRIVVNDRADVAVACGAALHLKGTSVPLGRLRAWLPPGTWVSCAVHSVADVATAHGADALVAGTVQATVSKPGADRWLGLDGLSAIAAATAQPVFAIGGVTGSDWPALARAGAAGLAAIGWMLPHAGEEAGAAVARALAQLRAGASAPGRSPGITS